VIIMKRLIALVRNLLHRSRVNGELTEEVGTALDLLVKRVSGSGGAHNPEKVLLRPRLIVRESCGSGPRERR